MTNPFRDQLEADYWALADELNDEGVTLTIDDFDDDAVANGKAHAEREGLAWPPPKGQLDWAYEQRIGPFKR